MFSKRVERLTSSLVRDVLAASQRPEMISFAGGLPATETLVAPRWETIPTRALQYGQSEGEPELREAIADYARGLGMRCDASQVIVVSGSQQGIDLVAKLFIDPGTPAIVESPTYLAALQVFELFGAGLVPVATGPDGIDVAELQRAARRSGARLTYLIPTFQNPTGTCYSSQARSDVARAVDSADLVLFEDDPYRDLAYTDQDRTPICAHVERASWIYQGTFSKCFLPGIRVGYMIASPDLMPYLIRAKQATDLHTNRIGQWLAHNHLVSPTRDSVLGAIAESYRAKRDAMHHALERHFGDLADWDEPTGGLFFWLKLRASLDTRELLSEMLEQGVAFMPGEVFFPIPAPPGHMRLNFSHASSEQMDDGLRRLAACVRSHALSSATR